MADDPKKRAAGDRARISKQPHERRDWAENFGVSGQALAGAVRAVGTSAKKVEAYLKEKKAGR